MKMPLAPDLLTAITTTILSSSRTAKGASDTSSSTFKKPLTAAADDLVVNSRLNVSSLLNLFLSTFLSRPSPSDIFSSLTTASSLVNASMGNQHLSPWRSWEGKFPEHAHPSNIMDLLGNSFCPHLAKQLVRPLSASDAIELAAYCEIEINGIIRPFADGCGRISRTLSSAILIQANYLGPIVPPEGGEMAYYRAFRPPWHTWKAWYTSNVRKLTL